MHLVLLPSVKGNHVKYFPTSGYLGLTPVKVEGVVQTRLDPDMKQFPSKVLKVSVRCYEARIGSLGGITTTNVLVDHSRILWSSEKQDEYTTLGDAEFPFSITLPKDEGGFSTTSYVEYKVFWRIEASLVHSSISGIGTRTHKHSDILLFRHDTPPTLPPTPGPSSYDTAYSKHGAPLLRYSLRTPLTPVGPSDIVSAPITLILADSNTNIRSSTMTIERRIQLFSPSSISQSSSTSSSIPITPLSASKTFFTTSITASSSNPLTNTDAAYASTTHLLPHSEIPTVRTMKTAIADAVSSTSFMKQADGTLTKTLTLPWPSARTNSRWSIGETVNSSELVSVRFYAHVKLSLSSPSGNDTVELPEREIIIVATNESERSVALAKYGPAASRSKSKSPGRQHRKERELDDISPLPSSSHSAKRSSVISSSHNMSESPSKKPSSRRPHTSAGPRDRPSTSLRNHVVGDVSTDSLVNRRPRNAPIYRISTTHPISAASKAKVTEECFHDREAVAEWEQMLQSIERQSSRKSHDMHGFKPYNGRNRRPVTAEGQLFAVSTT